MIAQSCNFPSVIASNCSEHGIPHKGRAGNSTLEFQDREPCFFTWPGCRSPPYLGSG